MKFKLFKNILQEKGKYSQGRVYLFLSILAYYGVLGTITLGGLHPTMDLDLEKFQIVIDALWAALWLFASYVFGGKITNIFKKEDKSETGEKEQLNG